MPFATLSPKTLDFTAECAKVIKATIKLIDPEGSDGTITKREWNYLFQDIYALCNARESPTAGGAEPMQNHMKLYVELKSYLETYTSGLRVKIESEGAAILKVYNSTFLTYFTGCEYMNKAFGYLNTMISKAQPRLYAQHGAASGSIGGHPGRAGAMLEPVFALSGRGGAGGGAQLIMVQALALKCWIKNVFELLRGKIVREMLREFAADRASEPSRLHVVQGSIDTLVKMAEREEDPLKHYIESFETPFLETTATHYQALCAEYLSCNDTSSYMVMAGKKLDEENARGRRVLHPTTYEKLIETCEQKLILDHAAAMQRECPNFLIRKQTVDLQRMYRLLNRVEGGLVPVLDGLESFVQIEATRQIEGLVVDGSSTASSSGGATPLSYVNCIIDLHERFSTLVKGPFESDARFEVALDKACRTVINTKSKSVPSSAPELLAKFVDSCLKKSSKAGSEVEIEERQIHAIFVFKYIDDKDLFQKVYAKMLAKRLIHGSSISEEAEAMMISKLKQRCGYEYTTKLQRMFTDMTLSTSLNARFNQTEVGSSLPFNLKMLVLQSGAWPIGSATSTFTVPRAVMPCMDKFSKFYEAQHSGRKLTWLHHISTADIKARLGKRQYEFAVTAFQMAVLLLFNDDGGKDSPPHTVAEIREATLLSEKEVQRTVRSLVSLHLLKVQPLTATATSIISNGSSGSNSKGDGGSSATEMPVPDKLSSSSGEVSLARAGMNVRDEAVPRKHGNGGGKRASNRRSSVSSIPVGVLEDETVLVLNLTYSNKKKKVKLSSAVQRETPQESKQLRNSVNEDRRFLLQAIAVRVMKTRRMLGHSLLIKEMIAQSSTRFKPTVSVIKRCIEDLIEKQYLERSPTDKHALLYIA